uniref:Putative LOV domain-containing protein n=1 Tax=Oxalis sp. BC-2016 TaxID=1799608 RepID=A0A126WYB3_9ROSI|nr:putative LOV domain-containing protein [Oxalis sp. BC-2016]
MDSQLGLTNLNFLIEQSFNNRYSNWVLEPLNELPDSFTITDPSISGHPIVFASKGFLKLSGYSMDEIIGQNGRIFQGPQTDRRTIMAIREAVREERAVQVNLLNYRKDGTPFWILFHMSPVFSKDDGRVIHFVAVQVPISRKIKTNGDSLSDDVMFGSCRKEVCLDSMMNRLLCSDFDSKGFNIEEQCEAGDFEKRRAANGISNILSVLTHYSELTGKLVCGKRCNAVVLGSLGRLNISLGRIKQSFVLTDPHLPDMPIVFASDSFLKLTGYERHEVLGRSCSFLYGDDTDPATLYLINESIQLEQPCTVRILSYRKDKSSFWNLLHISPVRNASGKIAYFIGVQVEDGGKNQDRPGMSPEKRHLSVVGAVKVAIRGLSLGACSSNS